MHCNAPKCSHNAAVLVWMFCWSSDALCSGEKWYCWQFYVPNVVFGSPEFRDRGDSVSYDSLIRVPKFQWGYVKGQCMNHCLKHCLPLFKGVWSDWLSCESWLSFFQSLQPIESLRHYSLFDAVLVQHFPSIFVQCWSHAFCHSPGHLKGSVRLCRTQYV